MRVLFYNDWHFGDIHMSRNYIKDIISILGENEYSSFNSNNPFILKDIPNLKHSSSKEGFDLYINTWIGQYIPTLEFQGCNFIHYYDIMKRVYSELNILHEMKNIRDYIPQIDYSKFELDGCNNFLSNHKKIILVCNNDVNSGQSNNYDMSDLINKISSKFIDFDIVISNYNCRVERKNNIYFANEIIKSGNFDLNEISYLSTKSDLILGRSSGPYSFSVVRENYDRKVPFVCLTNKEFDSWYSDESNITWSNDYTDSNILNIIEKKLYTHES